MKIIEKLKKSAESRARSRTEKAEERKKAVFEEELVGLVLHEAEKRRTARLPYELQWRLNTEYALGNQMCDVNLHRMTVENYEPLYDYMSREVFNRIAPIMQTRRAHLMSVNYDLTVKPGTDDYGDMVRAEAATALLRFCGGRAEYKEAFRRAVGLCEETGNAFFLTWWDPDKDGGAPAVTALTPYEVLPEDLTEESVEGQRSILIAQVKNAAEISELYGVDVPGGKVSAYGCTFSGSAGGLGYESAVSGFGPQVREDAAVLYTYMEKPTAAYPGGRLILVAGGKLLHCGELPYGRYPLVHVKSQSVNCRFFGKSVIETLIPYQRCYNGIKNRINDHVNRSALGQLLVEEGSVDADDLSERGLTPGEPVIYARGAETPKLLEQQKLSEYALSQCEQLSVDMEYAACVSGLMTDSRLPGGVISGTAISMLQHADAVRLSVYADNIRLAVVELCRIWLDLFRRYMTDVRSVPAGGEAGGALTIPVRREDLVSDDLVFESENELKTDREEARARYIEALKLGLFSESDGTLSKKAKLQALSVLLDRSLLSTGAEEQQMNNARRENAAFERGVTPEVSPFDDDALHLDVHEMYVLGSRFRAQMKSCPEKCAAMIAHLKAHREAAKQKEEPHE